MNNEPNGERATAAALRSRAEELTSQLLSTDLRGEAEYINAELTQISRQLDDLVDPSQLRPTPRLDDLDERCRSGGKPQFEKLEPGDLLFYRDPNNNLANYLWAKQFGHMGIYDGDEVVYETKPDPGVRLLPLQDWMISGYHVGLARAKDPDGILEALAWAKRRYGVMGSTPYNYWFPDKRTNDRLYCSQLVWKIFRRTKQELDSNVEEYFDWLSDKWGPLIAYLVGRPSVAPDEIALCDAISFYSLGVNP